MKKLLQNERMIPYMLVLPSLLFILILFLVPVFETFVIAFKDHENNWTTENFLIAYEDINFISSIKNTIWLLVAVVTLQTIMALAMAVLLTQINKGRDIYLYIWTIPLGISDLAGGFGLAGADERDRLLQFNAELLWLVGWADTLAQLRATLHFVSSS